jgi:hypothetical protein
VRPDQASLRARRFGGCQGFATYAANFDACLGRSSGEGPSAKADGSFGELDFHVEYAMKLSWLVFLAATLSTAPSMMSLNRSIADGSEVDLTHWTPPDITSVAEDSFSALVKYGNAR